MGATVMEYSFTRYLAAKQSVDDRSLNHGVYAALVGALPNAPLAILEAGAGTGTMIDRLAARGLLSRGGHYTAVDDDPANVAAARARLSQAELPVSMDFVAADILEFALRERGRRRWDVLIASAFLDLADVDSLLPRLFELLNPGGHFYFTINFDGLTILEPPIDPEFDEQVIDVYHRTMDERRVDGRPTGGSRAGRALLGQIPAAGGDILAAGSSDWVVLPRNGLYPADEAYFLRHILHFFEGSLTGRPELEPDRFADWLARRHAQIDAGELILIAHQLDVFGRV